MSNQEWIIQTQDTERITNKAKPQHIQLTDEQRRAHQ